MTIQIWKQPLFGNYRMVESELKIKAKRGNVYATWTSPGLFSSNRIPVSDELAAYAIGARRETCPHTGNQPTYGRLKLGYICFEKSSGEDCNTVESCSVCGYFRVYPGNPRFRAAFGSGEHADDQGHPHWTYMAVNKSFATITEASFNTDGQLTVPSQDDSTVIIWVHGYRHVTTDGPRNAAIRQFPGAIVMAKSYDYTILVDHARVKVDN